VAQAGKPNRLMSKWLAASHYVGTLGCRPNGGLVKIDVDARSMASTAKVSQLIMRD
jgi:hypothetical protein